MGIDVFMECTIIRLLTDGKRMVGAFGYWREQGRFVVFKAKVRRHGDRRHRQSLSHHLKFLGVHRRRHGAGL